MSDIKERGFTLLETILYIALFSVIITGAMVTAYELLRGSEVISEKITVQAEGNFITQKIDWVLASIASIDFPNSANPYSTVLSVTKYDGTEIDIQFNAGVIEMQNGSTNPFLPLTSDSAAVSELGFEYIPADGSAPVGVRASTTINGVTFETTKYIRK